MFRNPRSIGMESGSFEASDAHPVCRRPSKGFIPLQPGICVAHRQPAWTFEEIELGYNLLGFFTCGHACPQWIQRADISVSRGLGSREVVVREYRSEEHTSELQSLR